jgi:hypothetical protein
VAWGRLFAGLMVLLSGCRIGFSEEEPRSACLKVLDADPLAPSGVYEVEIGAKLFNVSCDMETLGGGWTQLAVEIGGGICPEGWLYDESVDACTPGKMLCGTDNLWPTEVEVPGAFREVRGRVEGLQFFSTDAFNVRHPGRIDGAYVEGLSITIGKPRTHIWTYAVGLMNLESRGGNCPCAGGNPAPTLVGEDYFCASGNDTDTWDRLWYTDLPLWDGGTDASCNPLPTGSYFYRDLGITHIADIELRLMGDDCDESIGITSIELFVR